jgi:uncharacterized protein with PIN domain
MKQRPPHKATFRFYEELNDFFAQGKTKTTVPVYFSGNPPVKTVIESIGIPHTEIDLILVNSHSVGFSHRLRDGDRVSVYPVFESLDISGVTNVRKNPLRRPRFILDVHLGKLARFLRMLGFDTLYKNDYIDRDIVHIARTQNRIILTRDVEILKKKEVNRGFWIRSQNPGKQLIEVLDRLDLYSRMKPFHRCMACNGKIEKVKKEEVSDRLDAETKKHFEEFFRCISCKKIYWKGSHYERMKKMVEDIRTSSRSGHS